MKTQPEDIILQKQWQELTVEEKSLMHELAENENDFNLLKQMLKVVGEQSQSVPVLNNVIEKNIRQELFPRRTILPWLMAAAAMIILAVGGWLFFFSQENIQELPLTTLSKPVEPSEKNNPPATIQQENMVSVNEEDYSEPRSISKEDMAGKKRPASSSRYNSMPLDQMTDTVQIAAINLDVAANPNLLDLVTKLY